MALRAGTRLGPYEIVAALGAGGMGEVYEARDTRLDRSVAIKVLPAEFSGDPDRRARFEREAKTIAGLNHPHICTLHDVGEAGGATYLVMEHLTGETLAQRLEKGPLPLEQALTVATEIADALTAAHRQGVIHRDPKPGNVVLTKSGAKLLDFGLAKLTGRGEQPAAASLASAPTQRAPLTAEGLIIGTLQYMAPEQIEGKPADVRTDLWALGAILYEMLAGRRAFEGTSAASLIGNIMKAEPRGLPEVQPLTPPAVHRVVRRCLAKEPDARWQTASDLADELQWIRESGGVVEGAAAPGVGAVRLWRSVAAVVLGALCVAVVATALWMRREQPPATVPGPRILDFSEVTDLPGQERFPSLSPDGKSVVYASRAAGNWDIFLQRVGGRNPVNLTEDSPADDTQPAYSPDGEWIAFRSERLGGGLFIMGATGESVRRVTDIGHNPAWSPDGAEIAYATEGVWFGGTRNADSQIWAVTVRTGERRLVSPGDGVQPSWSPHGQRIAYWQYQGGQRDLATVPARGGAASAVTSDVAMDWNPNWSPDGRYLYFSSNRGGSLNLWRVPVEESSGQVLGAPEPVTTPSRSPGHLSFSRDGSLLAYADFDFRRFPRQIGFDALTGKSVGLPLPAAAPAGAWQVSPSTDGEWLAFVYGRNQDDIFITRADGTQLRQLTNDPYRDLSPRWSPDGAWLLFFSNRSGRYQAWTVRTDGSGVRQLSEAADELWYPAWSPDGKRVAAFDSKARTTLIFDAGRAWNDQSPQLLPVLNDQGSGLQVSSWSPDGRLLAGRELMVDGRLQGVFVYSLVDKRFQKLTDAGGNPVWLQDSRRLVFSAGDALNLLDSQSRAVREIVSLAPLSCGEWVSISADNRTIYFSLDENEGNIWLASLK